MSVENGGYSADKKYIEQAIEQNLLDHQAIIEQNNKDHQIIIEQNEREHQLLEQIRNKYIPDVIIMQTKINIFGVILTIFLIPAVALAYRFLEGWLRGK